MKSRVFSEIKEDAREFFRTLPSVLKSSRRTILWFVLLALLLIFILHPYNMPWVRKMMKGWPGEHIDLAKDFRTWGDFRDIIIVTLILFFSGWCFRRREWRRLATIFFLSVCLAGVAANTLRCTIGRPRPYIRKVTDDRWYGPFYLYPKHMRPADQKFRRFQSFPSGHTTTSSAAAAMLLVAAPVVGIPMVISSVAIMWSCLYCGVHYATDLVGGMCFGIIFGACGGLVYRRMRAKACQSS